MALDVVWLPGIAVAEDALASDAEKAEVAERDVMEGAGTGGGGARLAHRRPLPPSYSSSLVVVVVLCVWVISNRNPSNWSS